MAARLCARCLKRPAVFRYRGTVKADPKGHHDLCQQCYRSDRDRQRARDRRRRGD